LALGEKLLELLAEDDTLRLDAAESAEVEFTVEEARAVPILPAARVVLELEGAATLLVDDGVNSALPAEAVAPDPAPEDDPAVFDPPEVRAVGLDEDWM
jgi:hypothetical protein